MTKHRRQNTKVRAKGIDSIWSQLCASLLHRHIPTMKSPIPAPGHRAPLQRHRGILGHASFPVPVAAGLLSGSGRGWSWCICLCLSELGTCYINCQTLSRGSRKDGLLSSGERTFSSARAWGIPIKCKPRMG